MAAPIHEKYYLKSLHQEIDLFDRKLAHLLKYDSFASEADRAASAQKMNAKRELLARTARQLVSEGVEFHPSDLPRSFRAADGSVEVEKASPAAEVPPAKEKRPAVKRFPSPFAGTVLDGETSLEEYKRGRKSATPKAG